MITASAIQRVRNCAASHVLARAESLNPWAKSGNEEHERLARWVDDRDDDAIADIVHASLLPRLSTLTPSGSRAEVKLGYDTATRAGRVIGYGGGRDYGRPGAVEIVGSADVVGMESSRVIVIDWKTGHSDVESAAKNGQLWTYALAACRALHCDSAIVRIVYTKTGHVDEYEIDEFELEAFANELERLFVTVARRQREHLEGKQIDTREGSWCKHCPSRALCPAKNALLVQVASKGLAVLGDSRMTADRAADAYREVMRVEQLVEDAKARLRSYVEECGPIDLGGGRMYGRYERQAKRSLDVEIAVQAMEEFNEDMANVAVKRTVAISAVESAAKTFGLSPRAVMKRIEQLGGVKQGKEFPIGEFAITKHKPAQLPDVDFDALDALMKESA